MVEPAYASLSVEHLKVLLVEHLKVRVYLLGGGVISRACFRILNSRACLRILMVEPAYASLSVESLTCLVGRY